MKEYQPPSVTISFTVNPIVVSSLLFVHAVTACVDDDLQGSIVERWADELIFILDGLLETPSNADIPVEGIDLIQQIRDLIGDYRASTVNDEAPASSRGPVKERRIGEALPLDCS